MPSFQLFGTQFQLIDGTNPVMKIGPFPVHGHIDFNATQATLAIALEGRVCGMDLTLSWQGSCQLIGNRVQLEVAPPPVVALDASAVFADRTVALRHPQIKISSDNAIGLELLDPDGVAFDWIEKRLATGLEFDMGNSACLIALDIRDGNGVARHRPSTGAGPALMWNDKFAYQVNPYTAEFGPSQRLAVQAVTVGPTGCALTAAPVAGILFLHADLLDTSTTLGENNQFLFQYAVANGRLRVYCAPNVAGAQMQWETDPTSAHRPALLLLHHQDEHGYPLAFVPDGAIPIAPRVGVNQIILQPDEDQWNMTNAANVIANNADPMRPLTLSGKLKSLDARLLYSAFADPQRAKNSMVDPWFVRQGTVPLSDAMPREVHGMARGVFLRRTTDIDAASLAALIVTPIVHVNNVLFHHTELQLIDAVHWDLHSLREERDLRADVGTNFTPAPVGSYVQHGIADIGAFSLPSVDLAFAVANLAGPDRMDSEGLRHGSGLLLKEVHDRIGSTLEKQFSGTTPSHFSLAKIPPQKHIDGARIMPASSQAFARLLVDLPTSARGAQDAGRCGPTLDAAPAALVAAPTSKLVFGGADGTVTNAVNGLVLGSAGAEGLVGPAFRQFEHAWRTLATQQGMVPMRTKLGITARPALLPQESIDQCAQWLTSAVAYLQSNQNVSDITDDAGALAEYLADITPEEFLDAWNDLCPDSRFVLLLEHLWSPANYDLMRRILRNFGQDQALINALFGPHAAADFLHYLDIPADGLLQGVVQGVDALWTDAQKIWCTSTDSVLPDLRDKYGPLLTTDVYARLLEVGAQEDAQKLLGALQPLLPLPLRRLGDLSIEPPDYLFRTKRFPLARSEAEPMMDAVWNQCFNLCAFATGKNWNFFLDHDASIVIKLGRKRSLGDVMREVVQMYAGADRPDPLGIRPYAESDLAPLDSEEIVNAFIADLDPDLMAAEWVGVLFIRPVADIHLDDVLRDLTGFDHIVASYVAVGGRKPKVASDRPPAIEVWAHILSENHDGRDLPADPWKVGDVKLALTKFDVKIRQTQLSDANIEVSIYPQDIWGKQHPDPAFPTIVLHGTLQAPADDPRGPKDLAFAAFFPTPLTLHIDLGFVKQLELSTLRVGRHNGATCIDIDGQLQMSRLDAFDLSVDLGTDDLRLALQNFRINIPTLPKTTTIPIGDKRNLSFDFPSLSFAIPKPRSFNLFGIELTPTGLGYIRGNEEATYKAFLERYFWLQRLNLGTYSPDEYTAYMELDADFGKAPGFGLVDARGLRFSMALALKLKNSKVDTAGLGIAGLDAKDLTLNLFGFLKLQIDQLRISEAKLLQGNEPAANHPPDAGAIIAKNIQLKIFNWSPAPNDSTFDLLLLNPTRDPSGATNDRKKGMLAFYDAENTTQNGFFKLFWVLLAHNLTLPPQVLNYLLEKSPGADDPSGMLSRLLEKPAESDDPHQPRSTLLFRDVGLLERESWLFGMSFSLGELFNRCTFILHDQHYYGIHLYAPWVLEVFQQDSIELAYLPGPTRAEDRFRTNLRIPALDMLGSLKSGEFALEWGVNWNFLIDIGYPWRTSIGYDWFRSFSVPVGTYEGKFGFFVEKRSSVAQDQQRITLAAGMGFYLGFFFGSGNSVAWVRAGIGVFAIVEGHITFQMPAAGGTSALLKSSIYSIDISGVVGIFAYGEGGVDVWILSARFRVSAQAAVACTIRYVAGGPCALSYSAILAAGYSASVQVGCGFFSWTFSVQGEIPMNVSGQLLLN